MDQHGRILMRRALRSCKRLGQNWRPIPPASEVLWGRGFYTNPGAPHPLLAQDGVAPASLQKFLKANTAGGPPFAPWLRQQLRSGAVSHGSTEGNSEDALTIEDLSDFLQWQQGLARCTTRSAANGLEVHATSGFVQLDQRSEYIFSYNMRFTNHSQKRYRVLSRQYDFVEEDGRLAAQVKPKQMEAAGVVGYTPLLEPGACFEFGSGTVMKSPRGSVSGQFLVMEEPDLTGGDAEVHASMEKADLMLRLVYYKGLGTKTFYLPLSDLQFDAAVTVLSLQPKA
eukprot:TRINITY_DN27726_c1_g1_i4.p1 TRINITY_DN27726_c1_g1~~TRINITY_DN27726_c1_g1_i4.p1  ORF type:complete len:283 (-),score=51.54 TRINITY_DN27726_c1_g1_i4:75-923(-)